MGQILQLQAADGHVFNAYQATPTGTPRGGLVLIQEIFGVNAHIRAVADGWAAEGYLVIAPALFDRVERGVEIGYTDADMQRGFGLKTATGDENPLKDIAAAQGQIRKTLGDAAKVAVLGFCWGGLLSWLSAGRVPGFDAAVPYYGGGIPNHADLKPGCPVLAHFGERDHWIPADTVQAFAAAQPGVKVHVYAADHGFNCDQRGSWDAAAAELARERSLAFLRQHVG